MTARILSTMKMTILPALVLISAARSEGASFYTTEEGLPSNNVNALVVGAGTVWAGTEKGLARYDAQKDRFVPCLRRINGSRSERILGNHVNVLSIDGAKVWVGFKRGLAVFDSRSGRWETPNQPDLVRSSSVRAVLPEKKHLWVGLWRGGLYRMDRGNGSWKRIWPKDPTGRTPCVYALTADGEAIYAGTTRGLLVLNREGEVLKLLTKADGLAHNTVTALVITDDWIWVASWLGLCRYNTNSKTIDKAKIGDDRGSHLSLAASASYVFCGSVRYGVIIADASNASRVTRPAEVVDMNISPFKGRIGGHFPMKLRCVPGLACDDKDLWIGMTVEAGGGGLLRTPLKIGASK